MVEMRRLEGRTVIVTGGGSGIGKGTCQRIADEGGRVGVLDRRLELAEQVAAEITGAGGEAMAVECDVTSAEACTAAVERVRAACGPVDLLVNNAGITHLGAFRDTDVDVIRRVVDVNFLGSVQMTKAALPSLLERRGGIVAISSVAGLAPLATRTGYAASKHALHGFFASLRAEHRDDGLDVLLVYPSFVETAIGDHALGPHGGPAAATDRTGVRASIPADDAAEAIVRAMLRGKRTLYVPWRAAAFVWIARLLPSLYERLMVRRTATPATSAAS